MSREIHLTYSNYDSPTLWAALRQPSTGKVWYIDAVTPTFETWGTLGRDADDYDFAVTSQGGSLWTADMPTGVPVGDYTIIFYIQSGASPSDDDAPISEVHGRWTGTQWLSTFDLMQGPGQTLVSVTVRTTGGTPAPGISVWVSDQNDSTTQLGYPRTTDASGQVEFYLSLDETYYVFCGHNNYSFADATIQPVSGTVAFTLDIATALTPTSSGEKKTCAELITRILHLVGRHDTSSTMPISEIILDALNEAMRKIAERVPQALELQVRDTTTYDVATGDYELDLTSISNLWHSHAIWVLNGTETHQITFRPKPWFNDRYPAPESVSEGLPTYWTRDGGTIRFSCPFSSNYNGLDIRFDYTKKPARFTSTSSTQTCDLDDADDGLILWAQAKALRAIAKGQQTLLVAAEAKESEWDGWLVEYESHCDLETEQNAEDRSSYILYEDVE